MNYSQQSSPNIKMDAKSGLPPYQMSPAIQQKKMHPFSLDTSQASLKNSLVISEELEFYRQRSIDLENYVRQLKGELDLTVQRLSKNGELDEKVELVLKQNQALSVELDRLQKQNAQRKTESDIWKGKYEQQLNASVQCMQFAPSIVKAGYELDIRNLSNQIRQLEDRNEQLQHDHVRAVDAERMQTQIEQQRQQYQHQVEILEGQVRKLRMYSDEQEKEVYDVQARFDRLKAEADREQIRLQKDVETMRTRLQEKEIDSQKDLSNLRSKLEILNQGALENIRGQYQTQMEILDGEVEKLKELLDIKNSEIETLIVQNQKQKANYEDEINTVRMQFDILKDKMLENEQNFDDEMHKLQDRLKKDHEREVQQLTNDKAQQRSSLEKEIARLSERLETVHSQIARFEEAHNEEFKNALDRYNSQLQAMQDFSDQQRLQIESLQNEIEHLQRILSGKKIELEATLLSFSHVRKKLDDDYQRLRQEYEELYLHQHQQDANNKRKIADLGLQLQQMQHLALETELLHTNEKDQFIRHIRSLEEELNVKDSEYTTLLSQKQALERDVRKLKEDLNLHRNQLVTAENISKKQLEELRISSEHTLQQALEEVHTQYNQQLTLLHAELSQIRTQLEMKTKEVFELTERFTHLDKALQDLRHSYNDQKASALAGEIKFGRSQHDSRK